MIRINKLIWDDQNVSHIAKHSVTVSEVETGLRDGKIKIRNTHSERFMLYCRAGKRLLSIIVAAEGEEGLYVVTARDMSKKERNFYLERIS